LALGVVGTAIWARAARADVLLGGTITRGFYSWEVMGGYEHDLPLTTQVSGLTFPVRVEAHFATRDGVTNMALSTYLLAFYRIPGFSKVDFGPYVATGPAFHLQGGWTNLGNYGDVLTKGEAVLKWQVLVRFHGRRSEAPPPAPATGTTP
jgi:hypothetical protein